MAIILAIVAAAATGALTHNALISLIVSGIIWGATKIVAGAPASDKYITITDMSRGTVEIMPQDEAAQKYLRTKGK